MGLREKLESKTAQQRETRLAAEAEVNEEELTSVRDNIHRKEKEKSELVRLGAELGSAYKEADRILSSFKGKKEILQQLFDTYRDVLRDDGIETRTAVLGADDYKDETEVTEYGAAVLALRDMVTRIVGLRAEIRKAFPDSGLVLTSGKREEGRSAIQARVGELEAEITALTEQMPEGQAAKRERIGQEYLEARAKRMGDRAAIPEVNTEDLKFADENGEERLTELLSEYCLRPMVAKIANEKKKVAYDEWERLREFPKKSEENRETLVGIYALLTSVVREFEDYIINEAPEGALSQLKDYGSRSAEDYLLHKIFLHSSSFNSHHSTIRDLENDANGFGRFLSDSYDQDSVADQFEQFSQRIAAYRGNFAAIMPSENREKEAKSLQDWIESPKEVGQTNIFRKILEEKPKGKDKLEYLRDYYSPKERKWKEQLDQQKTVIEIEIDRSIVAERLNKMGNEPAILKKRIENMRRIENVRPRIQRSLDTLREHSTESLDFVDIPEEYGWQDDEEQIITDHEAAIGDKAAETGLWGTAAKKEKGGFMGIRKDLSGAQSDRDEISRRQAIIDRMKEVKNKRRDDAINKERSRVETLTRSIMEIVELISDAQDSGNGSPARTLFLEAQRMGTVGGAVSILEAKIKNILDEQPSREEQEILAKYNLLLDRKSAVEEKLQRLQQATR
ncbi:MAG: hypothetical protein HGB34_03660 [Candidatus Moranbacteria bacterium]|nr:hypothetical protein [Candidatus Moranbacteria bacterium]